MYYCIVELLVNSELQKVWKEGILVSLMELSRHMLAQAEESREDP
jgi:hypothetical protein